MRPSELDFLVILLNDFRSSTLYGPNGTTSQWHAGLSINDFTGPTTGEKIVNAAQSIKVDILSPTAVSNKGNATDPVDPGYIPFTTKEMIQQAHKVGMTVKSWTVSFLRSCIQYTTLMSQRLIV